MQRKIKIAYNNYLADTLGVGSGFCSKKKLLNFLKNSRQDTQGIFTLKDSENTLHTENVKKKRKKEKKNCQI